MLVKNVHSVTPYAVSPLLRSRFIVLLVEPKNWRLLLLSEERSVWMRFIVSGVSYPVFTCWGLFPWYIVSMCELTMACPWFCWAYISFSNLRYGVTLYLCIICGRKNGKQHDQPTCKNRQWQDLYINIYVIYLNTDPDHFSMKVVWGSWLPPHFDN